MLRKEIIRFLHVRTEMLKGGSLKDFTLTVFSGEIIYLTGIHGSGKHSLGQLLEGQCRLTEGTVYINEIPVEYLDKREFRKKGIYVINGLEILSGNLNISENFFLLRPHRSGKFLYKEKYAVLETAEILKEYGILCNPRERTGSLTQIEQYLLCIAKAVSTGAKLLVVDCKAVSVNMEEYKRLADILIMLKEKGISTIVIDDSINPLLETADRALVVYDGRDLKVLSGSALNFKELAGYLAVHPLGKESFKAKSDLQAGKGKCREPNHAVQITSAQANGIIGIFDLHRDTRKPFEVYITEIIRQNEIDLGGHRLCDIRAACIPENNGELLLENMTIEDNLLLPSYRRVANRAGVVPKGIYRHVADFFRRELGWDAEKVDELERVERKLLCIRRWILARPEALFVENPDLGLDPEEQGRVFAALAEAAQSGIHVFVIAHNPYTLCVNSQKILQFECGRFQKSFLPENFLKQEF